MHYIKEIGVDETHHLSLIDFIEYFRQLSELVASTDLRATEVCMGKKLCFLSAFSCNVIKERWKLPNFARFMSLNFSACASFAEM